MDADRDAVIERLNYFDKQFEELLTMLDGGGSLTGGRKSEAQDRLSQLKRDLAAEEKDLNRRRDELNHWERAFLEPAVRKAGALLRTRVNSPPGPKWHSELYGARIEITYMKRDLMRPSKEVR
jgi:hypothetical protein